MTTRKMTNKMFLHRANGKAAVSAGAFLEQYREFLQNPELAVFTSPILLKVDSKELLPTPALEQLKAVVLAHHLAEEVRKAEEKMQAANEPGERKSKSYEVIVYNAQGDIQQAPDSNGKIKDLKESFDSSTKAESWADRRLFDGAPGWFAVVTATKLFRQDGTNFAATVLRDDAIMRILKTKKGPVMKAQKKTAGRIGFGVKAHPSRASFSHG